MAFTGTETETVAEREAFLKSDGRCRLCANPSAAVRRDPKVDLCARCSTRGERALRAKAGLNRKTQHAKLSDAVDAENL